MFYFLEDHGIENYTDGSTPYSAKTNHKLPMEELEKSSLILLKWLQSNVLVWLLSISIDVPQQTPK